MHHYNSSTSHNLHFFSWQISRGKHGQIHSNKENNLQTRTVCEVFPHADANSTVLYVSCPWWEYLLCPTQTCLQASIMSFMTWTGWLRSECAHCKVWPHRSLCASWSSAQFTFRVKGNGSRFKCSPP